MPLAGYYLAGPGPIVAFPRAVRFGGAPRDREENDLALDTEYGVLWVYKQSRRRAYRLPFRVTAVELAIFETLHNAVEGQRTPFYYMPDITAPIGSAIFVRKEAHFQPREVEQPAVIDGVEVEVYDYDLILREEIAASSVTV